MVPDSFPILSKGKHRSPKRGGCFMEVASYLAGERWSDKPACAHPVLASAARSVNDLTSDSQRHLLAPLIPLIMDTNSEDPYRAVELGLLCARFALSKDVEPDGWVLHTSALTAEYLLEQDEPELVLERHPWGAVELHERIGPTLAGYVKYGAKHTAHYAAHLLAKRPDRDEVLREYLTTILTEARAAHLPVSAERWNAACELVGTR